MDSEKIAVVDQSKQGRFVLWLAGAVALLAVAFIVFIACGTVVLQSQQTCNDTSTAPIKHEETVTKNIDVEHDNTKTHERITLYPESHVEHVVNRNGDTGHVESVLTIDYDKKTTTVYRAADNRCYMMKGYDFGEFDDTMTELEKLPDANSEAEELKLNLVIGDRVTNATEIPLQMSAFCSTHNTHYLQEVDPETANAEGGRGKRQTYICLIDCVYLGYYYIRGEWAHVYYCLYYFDWSYNCASPDSAFYYGYVW